MKVRDYRIYSVRFEDAECFLTTGSCFAGKAKLREDRNHHLSNGSLIVHDQYS